MPQPENGRHVAALSRVATALNSALSLDEVLYISIRWGLRLTGLESGDVGLKADRADIPSMLRKTASFAFTPVSVSEGGVNALLVKAL